MPPRPPPAASSYFIRARPFGFTEQLVLTTWKWPRYLLRLLRASSDDAHPVITHYLRTNISMEGFYESNRLTVTQIYQSKANPAGLGRPISRHWGNPKVSHHLALHGFRECQRNGR